MSAREKLLLWLRAAGAYGELAEAEADQILGRHAHELAEKIRDTPLPADFDSRYMGEAANAYLDGGLAAANLIDPEVET